MSHAHSIDETPCAVCGLSQELTYGRNSVRIVAESPAMQQVLRRVARIAPTDASVLLTGESGTGKEVVARAIHDASDRRGKRFVAINCAALPPDLLESELFGHARGAFSGAAGARRGLFEEAHGGTLFLDEIGELPAGLQAKLLRALQEGEVRRVGENEPVLVDVRVIAATNCDLPGLVAQKLFREDLYYRLKVFALELPPLRERREDVLPMARGFLAEEKRELRFSPRAEAVLVAWHWPGNVRELRNAVRHGAVLAEGKWVEAEDLPPELLRAAPVPPMPNAAAADDTMVTPWWMAASGAGLREAPRAVAAPVPAGVVASGPGIAPAPAVAPGAENAAGAATAPGVASPPPGAPAASAATRGVAPPSGTPAAPGVATVRDPVADRGAAPAHRAAWDPVVAAAQPLAPAPAWQHHHLAAFPPTAPLDEVVRAHVRAAVEACDGNRAAAARALGVGRNTLWRWLKGGRGAANRQRSTGPDDGNGGEA
mgnify:CR=1 FL=1